MEHGEGGTDTTSKLRGSEMYGLINVLSLRFPKFLQIFMIVEKVLNYRDCHEEKILLKYLKT